MTVNELLINTLQRFNSYITPDFSGDGAEEYITFTFPDDSAAVFGDDVPLEVVSEVWIHYFLPASKDYLEVKREIRKVLLAAGFTYPKVTVLMEPGNKTRHIIFECEIENEYEMED